jgi:starch synthase
VPAYLDHVYRPWAGSGFRRTASVQTIHNLAYQGSFDPADMALTGLDPRLFASGLLEAMGRLNFLKSGLVTADAVTTVSPTYAREIQTPPFGRYLDAVLRDRAAAGDLVGIVNGIDPAEWGPAADPHLVARYDFETHEAGKAACKADLQRRAGLHERPTTPLVAVVGRLDAQKGWDLLLWAADALMARELQFVVLGTGSHHYQAALADLAARYPGRAHAFLEFSEPMAHRIAAGADFVLMPSLYEPCGLIQLHSLAYGTIPIARETGGLADTIIDATPEALASGRATGILFRDADANGLLWAVDRALGFHHDPAARRSLIRAGMAQDWSWDRSAREYTALYRRLADRRAARSSPPARTGEAPAA